jgi:D-alanyl-D-alanine carboxypeptidase
MFNANRSFTTGCLLFAACLLAACGGGGNKTAGNAAPDLLHSCPPLLSASSPAGSLGSIVDDMVANEMIAQGLPGMTVALAKNGTILYAQGYGYADLSTCKAMLPTTELQIGSVTKQFTAAAILQLQDAGLLNIDNPVINYLPSYAFDPQLTLRMLLNQTSGLADYLGFTPPPSWINGIPQQAILAAIVQAPPLFAPGSAYAYSNSNYFVLGAVIEAVSSVSYADYMAAHIFQPVGLSHTSYLPPLTSASPYTYTVPAVPGTTGFAVGVVPDASVFFSVGTLWSNVQDLATWDAALLNGKVIPAALLTEMVTPPAAVPVYQQAGALSSYAMGWIRSMAYGHPVIMHNGRTFAYTAFNGVFLDNGFSLTILTNVDVRGTAALNDFAATLTQAICTSSAAPITC